MANETLKHVASIVQQTSNINDDDEEAEAPREQPRATNRTSVPGQNAQHNTSKHMAGPEDHASGTIDGATPAKPAKYAKYHWVEAGTGESCDQVCEAQALVCKRKGFSHVVSCYNLQSAFPNCSMCADSEGPDLPLRVELRRTRHGKNQKSMCLYNTAPRYSKATNAPAELDPSVTVTAADTSTAPAAAVTAAEADGSEATAPHTGDDAPPLEGIPQAGGARQLLDSSDSHHPLDARELAGGGSSTADSAAAGVRTGAGEVGMANPMWSTCSARPVTGHRLCPCGEPSALLEANKQLVSVVKKEVEEHEAEMIRLKQLTEVR